MTRGRKSTYVYMPTTYCKTLEPGFQQMLPIINGVGRLVGGKLENLHTFLACPSPHLGKQWKEGFKKYREFDRRGAF